MKYLEILQESAKRVGNCACMGLDPVIEAIPNKKSGKLGIIPFFEELFNEMKKQNISPAAFKPNIGYYAIYDNPYKGDFSGSLSLAKVMELVKKYFNNIPIILDSKRGDIARSSLNYAKEAFDVWLSDSTTVSPYMGSDSIEPFIKDAYKDKGIYLLNRTSNKGALDFQNLILANNDNLPLYIAISKKISSYIKQGFSVGAVVGATGMEELKEIASLFVKEIKGGVPLLIPGVGSQGGSASSVISILKECEYNISLIRINSSSSLTHPWKGKEEKVPNNYLEICISNIKTLLEECKI